tara:strand:+ start:227 stop:670 length:444 start_codon:yes stop_codon:yes gene_type:complete
MSKASDLARLITSGSTAIHGEAGVTASGSTGATTNLQQGLAKVLALYDQDTPQVRGSTNVSSVTDTSTGIFKVNLTNAMSSTSDTYISGVSNHTNGLSFTRTLTFANDNTSGYTTSVIPMETSYTTTSANNVSDQEWTSVIIHGDLA